MLSPLIFIGIILSLLIWAVIATIYAVNKAHNLKNCATQLRVANAHVDACNQYCGSAGQWASGQITEATNNLRGFLSNQKIVSCTDQTGIDKLISCTIPAITQNNSYWTMTDSSNPARIATTIIKALTDCASKIPSCVVQN